jgi:hypothetical protein
MIKTRTTQHVDMSLETFSDYNKAMFFDESIPPDSYTALADAIKYRFKANKSSGLSKMPLELLRHLGPAGISCVAAFLNASAID